MITTGSWARGRFRLDEKQPSLRSLPRNYRQQIEEQKKGIPFILQAELETHLGIMYPNVDATSRSRSGDCPLAGQMLYLNPTVEFMC